MKKCTICKLEPIVQKYFGDMATIECPGAKPIANIDTVQSKRGYLRGGAFLHVLAANYCCEYSKDKTPKIIGQARQCANKTPK